MVKGRETIKTESDAFRLLSERFRASTRTPNILQYTPHAKQDIFHRSQHRSKLYIGGNRSGKTTGGICEDIWWLTCRHPYRQDVNEMGPKRMRFCAVDFPNGCETIAFPQFKQWLYPSAIKGGSWEDAYNRSERTLHFSNGSFIEFRSYDQDLNKHSGTSRHAIHFDEEPPREIYVENMARLVDTEGSNWITMTPVEGMTWIFDDLYEPVMEGKREHIEIIEVDMRDNPHLTESGINTFLGMIDEEDREAREHGKFVRKGGLIYKDFEPTSGGKHVLDTVILDPASQFKDHMIAVSLDHGFKNPTAALWHAVDERGLVTTFHEYYKAGETIDKHAGAIKRINKELGIIPDIYIIDPSTRNTDPITGTSIHQEYLQFGLPFVFANNDVKAGLVRTHRYMRQIKRFMIGGKEHSRPYWMVSPACTNLIWEARRYRFKTYHQKRLNYEQNPQEEPLKKDDHACDALRYFIMSRPELIADVDHGSPLDQLVDNVMAAGVTRAVNSEGRIDEALAELTGQTDGFGNYDEWNEKNTKTDWDYDEHMGGIW